MTNPLVYTVIESQLGRLLAVADNAFLYKLTFMEIEKAKELTSDLVAGSTAVLEQLKLELAAYFEGKRESFNVPLALNKGTAFQEKVWHQLRQIPYGTTISYQELAQRVGQPQASRAVANANGANPIVILTPCHRVINKNGQVGGYSGGVEKKIALLQLEKKK